MSRPPESILNPKTPNFFKLQEERDRLRLELEIEQLRKALAALRIGSGETAKSPTGESSNPYSAIVGRTGRSGDESAASAIISGYAPDAAPPAHPYPRLNGDALYEAEAAGGLEPPYHDTVSDCQRVRNPEYDKCPPNACEDSEPYRTFNCGPAPLPKPSPTNDLPNTRE